MTTTRQGRRRSTTQPTSEPCCPSCGEPLGAGFIAKLAAPYVAAETDELQKRLTQEARAEAAAELASLRAKLKHEVERTAVEVDGLRAQCEEKDQKLKKALAEERKLRTESSRLQTEKDEWDLFKAREIAQIAKTERQKALRLAQQRVREEIAVERDQAELEHKAEIQEKNNLINSLKQQVADVHRKASNEPRPDLRGIAHQEVFANELQSKWPNDRFVQTCRGQRGADVLHTVNDGGRDCGKVLYECKDRSKFSQAWVKKLAVDTQVKGATIGVLVSSVPPPGVGEAGSFAVVQDGVVICDFNTAPHLVWGFRELLIAEYRHYCANNARRGASQKVYDYIATGDFMQYMHRIVDYINRSQQQNAKLRDYIVQQCAINDDICRELTMMIHTMIGELRSRGTELPQLQAELPPCAHRALPAGSATQGDGTTQVVNARSRSKSGTRARSVVQPRNR
jgi:hypothetical protein